MWRRVYLQANRFNLWKLILVIVGCLILLAVAIYRIMSPGPELAVQIAGPPAILDPAGSSSYAEKLINSALYEPLVAYDPETHLCKGLLVDQWEASQGGSVWTFHLRKGIRFHDGTQVTAQDVKASWERVLNPGVGNCGYLLENVAGSDGLRQWQRQGCQRADGGRSVYVESYPERTGLDLSRRRQQSQPGDRQPEGCCQVWPGLRQEDGRRSRNRSFPPGGLGSGQGGAAAQHEVRRVRPQLKTLTFLAVDRPQEITGLYEAGKLDVLAEAPAQVLSSLSAKEGRKGSRSLKSRC